MGIQLYRKWNETVRMRSGTTALHDTGSGEKVSFADLAKRVESNRKQPEFYRLRNHIVAIRMPNSAEWLEAFITCMAVGAIAMPVDNDLPDAGLGKLLDQLRPAMLWETERRESLLSPSRRREACLIKLTSGSTGRPKPLFFEDAQMIADGVNVISTMGIKRDDINLAAIPFGHSYGLGNLILPLLLRGTSLALPNDPFPHSLASAIASSQATVFPAVPTLLKGLVEANIPTQALGSLRLIISAGSPLHPNEAEAFRAKCGKRIHNFYGSSETGGISYDRTGEETLTGKSVGLPLENVAVIQHKTGRLMISSEAVLKRGNRRRHDGHPAFLLPDMGNIDSNGFIILKGRHSRMAKIAGKRLNLAEVEKALMSLEGVEAAFVTTCRNRRGRTRLIAATQGKAQTAQLKDGLKELLPAWKIPSRWTQLEAFPVTSRGKADLTKLEQMVNPQ